jgi:DNA mismatch repair protein MutS2
MNDHSLSVLEYDKVRSIVASFAASEAGKAEVIRLQPAADSAMVGRLLQETAEYMRILQGGETPPLDGIRDAVRAMEKLFVAGSVLTPEELLALTATLAVSRRIKKFFQRFEGKASGVVAPFLCERAAAITTLKELEDAVADAIDERTEVRDSASPELRKIRRQAGRLREDILARMNGILQDSGLQKVIQEQVITLRDDRYVLPLKPNFRQSVKGVVHGQSGSRATLFVEPLEVLEQNNRLAELRMEEREEVERILHELTLLLSGRSREIRASLDALTALDAIHARARFGIAFGAVVPEQSPDRSVQLRAARHPLLVGKQRVQAGNSEIMPNDILLENEQRALIVSGPNAGGKTVILKTFGLVCLMAQSGMPITASEGSRLPCFGAVFADIGDEQSLEQDLSTFSSHVSRIAEILREADRDSLVLLDELGSGTEPAEGAGLGTAVLETLIARGCVTTVTTHHNTLKLFASETAGAVNAAMEFDPQSLKPTYRMIMGRPGRSYGIDMAARLGVPADIVQRARERTGEDDVRLEKLLEQVENDARLLGEERQLLARELARVQQDRAEAEKGLQAARTEASDILRRARTDSRDVLAALRQKLRELSRVPVLERADLKKEALELDALTGRLAPVGGQATAHAVPRIIRPGSTVRLEGVNKTGVVKSTHGGVLELEVGGKTVKVASSEVVLVQESAGHRTGFGSPGWSADVQEHEGAPDRLNIIGLRVPEGLAEVDRFIDHAVLQHLSVVTVIHGLGTGALKAAVTDLLKNHPLVASIRSGEPAEGGAGVTVAELKK